MGAKFFRELASGRFSLWGHTGTRFAVFAGILLVTGRTVSPNVYYQYKIIAPNGNPDLTSIEKYASMNDSGMVAFIGHTAAGTGIFVGNGSGPPRNICPKFTQSNRFFGPAA